MRVGSKRAEPKGVQELPHVPIIINTKPVKKHTKLLIAPDAELTKIQETAAKAKADETAASQKAAKTKAQDAPAGESAPKAAKKAAPKAAPK